MSSFTLCIISTRLLSNRNGDAQEFFHDFSPLLWVQISMFAFGGLLVASVVKYTDSVQKGLATGLSLVASSVLSMMMEPSSCHITPTFIQGSILSIGGCFFFANPDTKICKCKRFSLEKMQTSLAIVSLVYTYLIVGGPSEMQKQILIEEPPNFWKESLHIHVLTHGHTNECGGCMVLHELADTIDNLNISTSRADHCPTDSQPAGSLAAGNKTLVFVYPEVDSLTCTSDGIRVHVRWILGPLGKNAPLHQYKQWGEDDLVFNYASSIAVHPSLLPSSNILQVITSPKAGDQFDLPAEIFDKTDRQGTALMMRKGLSWHSKIDHVHNVLPEPHVEVNHPTAAEFLKFEYFCLMIPTHSTALLQVCQVSYQLFILLLT